MICWMTALMRWWWCLFSTRPTRQVLLTYRLWFDQTIELKPLYSALLNINWCITEEIPQDYIGKEINYATFIVIFFSHITGCTIFSKDVTLLPEITNEFLKEHLYYSVSSNCVRIDACADFTLDLGPHIPPYTKAFKVFIDVDFCNFIVTVGFEKWKETLVLISYKWGKSFTSMF